MTSKLVAKRFRITNFRNIEDSDWIEIEKVTALVGRNESGKTALLKALHKFNPATTEPYDAQKEFPRDRFTRDYSNGGDWPVCCIEFRVSGPFSDEIEATFRVQAPKAVVCTRYYDGSLTIQYDTPVIEATVTATEITKALGKLSSSARRIVAESPDREDEVQSVRSGIIDWATQKVEELSGLGDLRNPRGVEVLRKLRGEINQLSNPLSANLIEDFVGVINDRVQLAQEDKVQPRLDRAIREALPVFIYFENYGVLNSAVYLPRFLEDLNQNPNDPRVRTINAMFKHVKLEAKELLDLGHEEAAFARNSGQQPTSEMIRRDQERKELRAVRVNSASIDITNRFSRWFRQRRHQLRYHTDGAYFRIWVSDDRKPGVDIELESRSKGFQWFFSFYLVFLVESEEGHRDAVLLLDEPGLNLHPTAQQELIEFFEELSTRNILLYSTHSPFLIDGEHIHRVRPVTEDAQGHSRISQDGWPSDRETIFPLQAAAGYAMLRGLFQNKKNLLVEGLSDYLYLQTLNLVCRTDGRKHLPDEIYVTPCGGTKNVGYIASLFLGQSVRPLVLLDGDEAGRARRDALLKELYAGARQGILMLSDVLGRVECEVEDIVGESVLLDLLSAQLGVELALATEDRTTGSIVDQISTMATRVGLGLPESWKSDLARRFAMDWSLANPGDLPVDVLSRAEQLFVEINRRFDSGLAP